MASGGWSRHAINGLGIAARAAAVHRVPGRRYWSGSSNAISGNCTESSVIGCSSVEKVCTSPRRNTKTSRLRAAIALSGNE